MKNMKVLRVLTIVSGCLCLMGGAGVAATEGDMHMGSSKSQELKKATFAGGCFWCMESPFEKIDGVESVVSGYIGGKRPNPSYAEVSSGQSGHVEAVEIIYDPKRVNYETLLNNFWRNIDPTQVNGQFADIGSQYRTVIYTHDTEQAELAQKSKAALAATGKFKQPIATEIVPATEFYPAEDYHQDYYKKNPVHYKSYHVGSGRAGFIKHVWGQTNKQ